MTLLTTQQRAIICADTQLDRILLDRCVDAFDVLLKGDVDGYKLHMSTAVMQMGYEGPVRPQDRPTAVDKAKTLIIHAYADREHIPYQRAVERLRKLLQSS